MPHRYAPGTVHLDRLSHTERVRALGPAWRARLQAPGDLTTPPRSTGALRALCAALVGRGRKPELVAVEPWGPPLNCHLNARRYARDFGGAACFGWLLWQGTNYLEAEAHSVVRDPQGRLRCVTTARDGEAEVLFLADDTRQVTRREYTGDPEMWLFSSFFNVPARDPRVFEERWLMPKSKMDDLPDWESDAPPLAFGAIPQHTGAGGPA